MHEADYYNDGNMTTLGYILPVDSWLPEIVKPKPEDDHER